MRRWKAFELQSEFVLRPESLPAPESRQKVAARFATTRRAATRWSLHAVQRGQFVQSTARSSTRSRRSLARASQSPSKDEAGARWRRPIRPDQSGRPDPARISGFRSAQAGNRPDRSKRPGLSYLPPSLSLASERDGLRTDRVRAAVGCYRRVRSSLTGGRRTHARSAGSIVDIAAAASVVVVVFRCLSSGRATETTPVPSPSHSARD